MLALDNNRQSWATIGLSDQFARHMGIYMKGKFSKLQYRISLNESLTSSLDALATPTETQATYNGRALLGGKAAGKNFSGYFDYQFMEEESNFLPYKVGTYLGSKRILNVGTGFFVQPNGSVITGPEGTLIGQDVVIFSVDGFYDAPVGSRNASLTAYAQFQSADYGLNYTFGSTYETGNMFYTQLGYTIPGATEKVRYQPYVTYNNRNIDTLGDNATRMGLGGNIFLTGHHSKLTLEYARAKYAAGDSKNTFTLQAMIYL
jgi:hypothetical protein